ncbi:MAG: tetratricopeptide repeat protein [Terracidiphilus sp.]
MNFQRLTADAAAYFRRGQMVEAVACYQRALALRPECAELENNLGVALEAQGSLEEAVNAYRRALEQRPEYAEARFNLGNVDWKRGNLQAAVESYRRVLAAHPNHVEAHCNLGSILHDQGSFDAARLCYERALEIQPDSAYAAWNRSLLQLLHGDFASGWRNFEARRRTKSSPRHFPEPLWRGQPLDGARILLHAEQGLGDTIQFLRYLPMVQASGGSVVLCLPTRLRRIARLLRGVESLVATGEPLPPFDCQIPLMSLPLVFGTNLENIPARVPYLNIPEDTSRAASRLVWPATGLRVGIAWAGSPSHAKDRFRSMPFSVLAPLLRVEGVHFFSLQMGPASRQLAAAAGNLTDLAPFTSDLADTAAQMAHLDLVITVDTCIAHLAGALAVPVWTLLGYAADWRWLLNRDDSPWYPTMRLFRQPSLGAWHAVMEEVRAALVERAADPVHNNRGMLIAC